MRTLAIIALAAFFAFGLDTVSAQDATKECNSAVPQAIVKGCSRLLAQRTHRSAKQIAIIYARRGWARIQLKQYHEAVADLSISVDVDQSSSEPFINRAAARWLLGDHTKALADFSRAITIKPDASVFDKRGRLLVEMARYKEAIEDFTIALTLGGDNYAVYFQRARCHRALKDNSRALADYTKAISLDATLESLNGRGNVHFDMGNFDLAIMDFTRAIDVAPDERAPRYNRGLAYQRKKDFVRAMEDYKHALLIDPTHMDSLENIATIHEFNDRSEEAILYLTRVIDMDSGRASAYGDRGRALLRLGRTKDAISDADKVIAIDSSLKGGFYVRSVARALLGEYRTAEEDVERAIALLPRDMSLLYLRSAIRYSMGRKAEADADYSRAIAERPSLARMPHPSRKPFDIIAKSKVRPSEGRNNDFFYVDPDDAGVPAVPSPAYPPVQPPFGASTKGRPA